MTRKKPIDDAKAGQIQWVASWRTPAAPDMTVTAHRDAAEKYLRDKLSEIADLAALCVAAYEIGHGGETSEFEGTAGPLALTEADDVEWHTGRGTTDVPTEGKL